MAKQIKEKHNKKKQAYIDIDSCQNLNQLKEWIKKWL